MPDSQKSIRIEELDVNMKTNERNDEDIVWLSPKNKPIQIAGFAWWDKDNVYRRLPVNDDYGIPHAVNELANCTAGGQIRFRTDACQLSLRVTLTTASNMDHMPATGQCGFDCYVGAIGSMKYQSTARFNKLNKSYECQLMILDEELAEMRDITLNFPLYSGVEDVEIGLNRGAAVEEPVPYASSKRIIFYGTSITQGGCANRPGMAYTNILSRTIPLEHINLGFSGNGKGESVMARLISDIEEPACLVLDYEANVGGIDGLRATLPEFIRIYRSRHPEVPILVVSRIAYASENLQPQVRAKRLEQKQFQQELVQAMREAGDNCLYFLDGEELAGADHEATVDGVHPTDLGFMRMAEGLRPVIGELVGL